MPKGFFDRTQKIRTVEQMNALLAQRTEPAAQGEAKPQVRPSASRPASPLLQWMPRTPGMEAILSACGRYSVSRSPDGEGFKYIAWSRLPTPSPLGTVVFNAADAKALCQTHSEETR